MEENEIVDIKEEGKNKGILNDKQRVQQIQKRPTEKKADPIKQDATSTKPMGLDPNAPTPSQSKVPLKTIDQLLIHNSDTAVKPIIGNKDIEKV